MRVEGEYINVNDLYGSVTDGSGGKAKGMLYNSSKARYAEVNGIVKYDHWITVLEASNTNVSADGGYVSDLLDISSYGTDYKGTVHQMKDSGDLSFSMEYIPKNTETSKKTHSVTITQVKSGKSVTVILTQAAAENVYTVSHILNVGTPSAKGGWVQVSVSWTRYKNGEYYDSGTAYPSISGYASVDGAYASGSEVYIPNAGTNTSQPTAYTITSYSFTVGDEEYEESASKRITLGYNYITDTSTEYSVSCGSASVTSIANTGGTFSFTATCQSRETTTYYSGSVVTGSWSNASATVGYSNGVSSVSPTSFTGSATVTATVGVNTGSLRTPTVRVSATDGTSDVVTVQQASVSYKLQSMQSSAFEMAYNSKSFSVAFVCTTNGTAVEPKVDVSGSYVQGYTVTRSTSSPYPWVIKVTLTETNTSSQNRQYTVKVTHPSDSSLYETVTVTHKTMSSEKPSFMNTVYAVSNGWYLGQMKIASAVINSTSVNIYAIVAAKKNAITSSTTLSWEFTTNYLVGNPNGSGLVPYDTPQEYKSTQTIAAGTSNNISGTTIYGIQIVGGSPERFIDLTKTLVFTAT